MINKFLYGALLTDKILEKITFPETILFYFSFFNLDAIIWLYKFIYFSNKDYNTTFNEN